MPNDFYEKTVEDIIFENRGVIHNYGLSKFRKVTFRQLILPSGKKIDILSYDLIDGHIVIDIYELKRYDINTDAICQAYNYYMEVYSVIGGLFKSIDIHIIMVGRNYAPVMFFEKMNLPFSVFTYDYTINGMRFTKHQERMQVYAPNKDFGLGLWAFGSGSIHYANGQPDTVNLANVYASYRIRNKDDHARIEALTGSIFTDPVFKEVVITKTVRPKFPETIKTEVFPLQPSWTPQFANTIPADEYMQDFDIDDSDFECEEMEADCSDYEPDIDEDDIQRANYPTEEEKEVEIQIEKQESDRIFELYAKIDGYIHSDNPHIKQVDDFLKRIQNTA